MRGRAAVASLELHSSSAFNADSVSVPGGGTTKRNTTERNSAMADLLQSSRLFRVSSKLQSASTALSRSAEGGPPEAMDHNALTWAGEFLSEVDWTCESTSQSGLGSGSALQATSARPYFYRALMRVGPDEFKRAGVETEAQLQAFLRDLYGFLQSAGKGPQLSREQLELASQFLSVIARSILAQLNNNGLPRRPVQLSPVHT